MVIGHDTKYGISSTNRLETNKAIKLTLEQLHNFMNVQQNVLLCYSFNPLMPKEYFGTYIYFIVF